MCASRTERRHGFHPRLKTKFCGKTHQILNARKKTGICYEELPPSKWDPEQGLCEYRPRYV